MFLLLTRGQATGQVPSTKVAAAAAAAPQGQPGPSFQPLKRVLRQAQHCPASTSISFAVGQELEKSSNTSTAPSNTSGASTDDPGPELVVQADEVRICVFIGETKSQLQQNSFLF